LALCVFCILSNVLDPRTYSFPEHLPQGDPVQLKRRVQFDYNALSPSDRKQFTFFRGLALNLISWIDCNYSVVLDSDPSSIEDLATLCFRRQVGAVLNYKARALNQGIPGFTGNLGPLRQQLQLLLDMPILGVDASFLDRMDIGSTDCFGVDPSTYRVSRRGDPGQFEEQDSGELGMTKGDRNFWQGTTVAFQLDNEESESEGESSHESSSSEAGSSSDMQL